MIKFEFYRTFYDVRSNDPVVIGYETAAPKIIEKLKKYPGRQFIHSGNWWNIPPEERTPDKVIEGAKKLVNERTDGMMSINWPPGIGKPGFSKESYLIWGFSKNERSEALRKSLEHADRMLELKQVDVPLYCSYEVGTFEDALEWYGKAVEHGHRYFGAGFGAFFKPGIESKLRMVDVIVGAKKAIGDLPFHCSGLGSLNLIFIVCYLGATSCDGSTPIRGAVAFGQLFDEMGREYKILKLRKWKCLCPICEGHSIEELRRNFSFRVLHNVWIWRKVVDRINEEAKQGDLKSYIEERFRKLKIEYYWKIWDYAKEMVSRHLRR